MYHQKSTGIDRLKNIYDKVKVFLKNGFHKFKILTLKSLKLKINFLNRFKKLKSTIKMSLIMCDYCNNKFNSISALNYHQKKTKYCLLIQGKIQKKQDDFKCEVCNKI